VLRVLNTSPEVYVLENLLSETLAGVYYREELIPSSLHSHFPVDIVDERINPSTKKKEYLVHFHEWSNQMLEWIQGKDLRKIGKKS